MESVGCEVLTAVSMKVVIFWIGPPCVSLVRIDPSEERVASVFKAENILKRRTALASIFLP
jgi:hypothetical protein